MTKRFKKICILLATVIGRRLFMCNQLVKDEDIVGFKHFEKKIVKLRKMISVELVDCKNKSLISLYLNGKIDTACFQGLKIKSALADTAIIALQQEPKSNHTYLDIRSVFSFPFFVYKQTRWDGILAVADHKKCYAPRKILEQGNFTGKQAFVTCVGY